MSPPPQTNYRSSPLLAIAKQTPVTLSPMLITFNPPTCYHLGDAIFLWENTPHAPLAAAPSVLRGVRRSGMRRNDQTYPRCVKYTHGNATVSRRTHTWAHKTIKKSVPPHPRLYFFHQQQVPQRYCEKKQKILTLLSMPLEQLQRLLCKTST